MLDSDESDGAPIRLQAFLARAGVASRRAAERLILEGRVAVNGAVVLKLGTKVNPGDSVAFDGAPLAAAERKRYLILNKPAGYLCTMSDPEGRPLAADLLRGRVTERVYNVGRLDQWSCGLLFFTNDGEIAAKLVHPSGGIDKEYEFTADRTLDDAFFASFLGGATIDGLVYRALSAERTGPATGRIILLEGKNREIRRVLEATGRKALSLKRIRIGPLVLGDLPEGAFRDLTEQELDALRAYGKQGRGSPSSDQVVASP
jgi:23S rRNA pseudouridine2605 synthase